MSVIRDRSVVKSSAIPSAKYCWSGSLLRLPKGSTTIDMCGAARGCATDVAAATPGVEAGFAAGHSHHAPTATTSTAAAIVAIATRAALRRRDAGIGAEAVDRSATALGRKA